jgi:hypothetical protein
LVAASMAFAAWKPEPSRATIRMALSQKDQVQKRNLTGPCSDPLEIIASNCLGSAFACISTIRRLSMLGCEVILCTSFVSIFLTKITSFPPSSSQLTSTSMLFDWLVTGHVIDVNPAHAVRGPKYVVKKGKTPVLTAEVKNAQRSKTVKVLSRGYANESSGASIKARFQKSGSS